MVEHGLQVDLIRALPELCTNSWLGRTPAAATLHEITHPPSEKPIQLHHIRVYTREAHLEDRRVIPNLGSVVHSAKFEYSHDSREVRHLVGGVGGVCTFGPSQEREQRPAFVGAAAGAGAEAAAVAQAVERGIPESCHTANETGSWHGQATGKVHAVFKEGLSPMGAAGASGSSVVRTVVKPTNRSDRVPPVCRALLVIVIAYDCHARQYYMFLSS